MLRLRCWSCLTALGCCWVFIVAVAHVTSPEEVDALRALKGSLIDPMNRLRNWDKGDPCKANWTGVLCVVHVDAECYFHVTELQLLSRNLSGSLVPELSKLSQLQILDFMWNDLNGTIPKEIGNIKSLKLLLLNGNKLSGSLPDELGYLEKLERLQVDENHLSGSIPKSFGNLGSLKHLHMNNNSFTGQIPSEISKISTLLHLLLDNNDLSGYLPPEFSNIPELRILQLDNNNFAGTEIPATYGNLSKLAKLSLRKCSLQGAIPDLGGIYNLKYLDLSWNQLAGPIASLRFSNNMTTIDLSDNHLNGTIPESFSSLQKLWLENNLLTGSVPTVWRNIYFSSRARLTLYTLSRSVNE